jgi:proton glutamate symport protein
MTTPIAVPKSSRITSLTTWSLLALGAGLLLGVLGHGSGHTEYRAFADAIKPLGDVWLNALQMMVLPFIIAHTVVAIAGAGEDESVGALGARAVVLFVVMLVGVALVTVLVAPLMIARYPVDPAGITALTANTPVPDAARAAAGGGSGSLGEAISAFVPRNLFEAAVRGDLLPLLLFATMFAVAVRQLPAEPRESLKRTFEGLASALFLCVRWLLWLTPVGVFVFTFLLTLRSGGQVAGIMGALVLIQVSLLIGFTLLLYPVTALFGRTSMRTFARAVAPAQIVAFSTRSSIASLPALVEGGRAHLDLPVSATGFVLPLSVSVFKVNRTISATAKLLFLTHVYGIPVSGATLTSFIASVVVLSFSTVGLPMGGIAFKTLPAYLAAGVPLEGIVIAEAVETIPDMFKTLLNVTGNMTAATLLSRGTRAPSAEVAGTTEPRAAAEGAA